MPLPSSASCAEKRSVKKRTRTRGWRVRLGTNFCCERVSTLLLPERACSTAQEIGRDTGPGAGAGAHAQREPAPPAPPPPAGGGGRRGTRGGPLPGQRHAPARRAL